VFLTFEYIYTVNYNFYDFSDMVFETDFVGHRFYSFLDMVVGDEL